jgi:Fe-S oxidoreductase
MTSLPRLPLLEPRAETLEKCVYCPKLCRAACPVSNAQQVETLTPWGKMSMAYFAARGDVPIDRTHAEPAWACTGCYGCKERCDHKNEVTPVLLTARAELYERGVAPEGAIRAAERARERADDIAAAARALGSSPGATAALLVGCGYLVHHPEVAARAKAVTEKLLGKPVRVVEGCCGLSSQLAGDAPTFKDRASALAREVDGVEEIVAVDPGCAGALLRDYDKVGVTVKPPRLLVDLAHEKIADFTPAAGGSTTEPPRYHDPCQLGRVLGKYEEPRALLERIAGAPPREFERNRERADCSGGGGVLPLTFPEASRGAAASRIAEHRRLGGGAVVTACASSLRRLKTEGADVEDLVTWLARGLGI